MIWCDSATRGANKYPLEISRRLEEGRGGREGARGSRRPASRVVGDILVCVVVGVVAAANWPRLPKFSKPLCAHCRLLSEIYGGSNSPFWAAEVCLWRYRAANKMFARLVRTVLEPFVKAMPRISPAAILVALAALGLRVSYQLGPPSLADSAATKQPALHRAVLQLATRRMNGWLTNSLAD